MKKNIVLLVSSVLLIVLFMNGCGGGGSSSGGGSSNGNSASNTTTTITGQATLGPLSGSKIILMDLNESIIGTYTSKTSDSDLNNAGAFSFTVENSKIPTAFLLVASGGKDIDPLDDDAMNSSIDSNGSIHAILTTDYIKTQGLKINPLTEIIYQDALNTYGDTLASLSKTNLTSYLDSEAKKYLTNANATYADILAFTPRKDKLKSKIPWGKVLSLVVSGIHSGEISANINQRVQSIKGWLKNPGVYTNENNKSIEQLSDDGNGDRIITSITKSEDNTSVSTLKQIFTTKNGEIVNIYVSKVNDTESYLRASVQKLGHKFSIEGKTTLLQGLAFDTNTIATFINSLISVSDSNSSTVQITIAKELTTRLSDGEVVMSIDDREPTAEELQVITDDPLVKWDVSKSNKSTVALNFDDGNGIKGKYLNSGTLVLEMSIAKFDELSGLNEKKKFLSIGNGALSVFKDTINLAGSLACDAYSIGTAIPCVYNTAIGLKLAADDVTMIASGVDTLFLQAKPSILTGLIGKKNSYGNLIIGESYQPIIFIRNESSAGGMYDLYDETLKFSSEISYKYYLDDDAYYAPKLVYKGNSGNFLFSYKVSPHKGYIVFPSSNFSFISQFKSSKYTYMKATVDTVSNKPIYVSSNNDYFASNKENIYTNFTYTYSNNPDELALNASSSIAPSGETITDYSWLNPLGQEIKNGKNVIMTPNDASLMMITKNNTATITLKTTSSSGKIGKKTKVITGLSTNNNNGGIAYSEDFEDGALNAQTNIISTGSFNVNPGIKSVSSLGGNKAFGFGESTCTASCNTNYQSSLIINFNKPTYIDKLSFKYMELYGDWGSLGAIYVDGVFLDYFKKTTNTYNADLNYMIYSSTINKTVNKIELRVWDITNASEMFIDDLKIGN